MTPQEQEIALKELEERVDRLRVLYDQYFLGFEKLEPAIPRKEVDRRLAMLRKENIRNTGLRFRFNVVTQKYNTYSMYWTRICRQIEEGTFKRHLAKAKKIMDGGVPRRRRKDDDLSLDIDVEFEEDLDMDALLAEAEASVTHEMTGGDTIPPASAPPAQVKRPMPAPATGFVQTQRQREVLDEAPPSSREWDIPLGPSAAAAGPRAPIGAAVPAGAKKQIIRKKDGSIGGPIVTAPPAPAIETPPPSNPRPSTPRIALPPMPGGRTAPVSAPRIAAAPAAPPQSTPRIPAAAPPPASSARIPAGPQSTPRVALPAMPPRTAGAPASANKIPAAAPPPNSSPRMPAASPSAGRIPLPAPPPRQPRPAPPSDPDDEG